MPFRKENSALLFMLNQCFIASNHTQAKTYTVKTICLFSGVQDADLSVLSQTMAQCCKNIKETVQMLASRHKDIHGSVSKVGKAIDRVRPATNFL